MYIILNFLQVVNTKSSGTLLVCRSKRPSKEINFLSLPNRFFIFYFNLNKLLKGEFQKKLQEKIIIKDITNYYSFFS